jgi:hypothetical protein
LVKDESGPYPIMNIMFEHGQVKTLWFENWDDLEKAYSAIVNNPSSKSFVLTMLGVRIAIYTEHILWIDRAALPEKPKRTQS